MYNFFGIYIFLSILFGCKTLQTTNNTDVDDSYFNSSDMQILRQRNTPQFSSWSPYYIPFGIYYPVHTFNNYSFGGYVYPRPQIVNPFMWQIPFHSSNIQNWYWLGYNYNYPRNFVVTPTPPRSVLFTNTRVILPRRTVVYTPRNRRSSIITISPRIITKSNRKTSIIIYSRNNSVQTTTNKATRIGGPRGGRNK